MRFLVLPLRLTFFLLPVFLLSFWLSSCHSFYCFFIIVTAWWDNHANSRQSGNMLSPDPGWHRSRWSIMASHIPSTACWRSAVTERLAGTGRWLVTGCTRFMRRRPGAYVYIWWPNWLLCTASSMLCGSPTRGQSNRIHSVRLSVYHFRAERQWIDWVEWVTYIFILFHQTGSEIHTDTDTHTQINTTHTNILIYKYEHMNT